MSTKNSDLTYKLMESVKREKTLQNEICPALVGLSRHRNRGIKLAVYGSEQWMQCGMRRL